MRAAALVLTVVLVPSLVLGEPAKKDALDKKALDVLKDASTLFKDAKSFHSEAEIETVVTDGGKTQKQTILTTVDYQKPTLLAVHARNPAKKDGVIAAVCDGKAYRLHVQRLHEYTEVPCPDAPDKLGLELSRTGANVGLVPPNVINHDPYAALLDGVTDCSYAGKEPVGGTSAHHLKFAQPGLEWELLVAAEGKPLVLKAVSSASSDDRKTVTTEIYKKWQFDGTPGKDTFTFAVPADSKKVEDFTPAN